MPAHTTNPDSHEIVEQFERFYRSYYTEDIAELARRYPSEQRALYIDWQDLYRFDHELADNYLKDPTQLKDYAEEALRLYDLPVDVSLSQAHVRIHNLANPLDASQVSREKNLGRLIAVEAQVQKTSKVKPKIIEAAFECQRCGVLTRVPQSDGSFQEPHECQGCERQGPFSTNMDQSDYENHQYMRIQQPPSRTQGGNAAEVDVHLSDDLIATAQTGDRITVTGVLQLAEKTGNDSSPTFDVYIDAHSVIMEESDYEDIDVDEHLDDIRAIANGEHGDPYELLVDSMNPRHHGDEDIKLAIALQMFGGWAKGDERGDSHILIMGDPGRGKSTFLHAVDDLAPRSTYASGKGATAAGLTAAAVSDDFGDSEWGLEAGALVLADGGVACIDELDKVPESAVSSLHGALEDQQVHVNKAGINTSLSAQTALLAAGNPEHGRFDDYDSWAEQIDLDPPLISRFDLLFLISDRPDEEKDREIIDHKMEARYAAGKKELGHDLDEEEEDHIEPAISPDVLRAYIAHAKETCFPLLEPGPQREQLREYFTELRQAGGGDSPVPVTWRKEEAIERLAEASARVRLSDTVEQQDIERAVELVEASMKQVGVDPETGEFDADVVATGESKSQRERRKLVMTAIDEDGCDTVADLNEVLDVDREKIQADVDKLKQQGRIYETGAGLQVS